MLWWWHNRQKILIGVKMKKDNIKDVLFEDVKGFEEITEEDKKRIFGEAKVNPVGMTVRQAKGMFRTTKEDKDYRKKSLERKLP